MYLMKRRRKTFLQDAPIDIFSPVICHFPSISLLFSPELVTFVTLVILCVGNVLRPGLHDYRKCPVRAIQRPSHLPV